MAKRIILTLHYHKSAVVAEYSLSVARVADAQPMPSAVVGSFGRVSRSTACVVEAQPPTSSIVGKSSVGKSSVACNVEARLRHQQ